MPKLYHKPHLASVDSSAAFTARKWQEKAAAVGFFYFRDILCRIHENDIRTLRQNGE